MRNITYVRKYQKRKTHRKSDIWRQCTKKITYHTFKEAKQEAQRLNDSPDTWHKPQRPYDCPHCDHWHIGRAPKQITFRDYQTTWELELGERVIHNMILQQNRFRFLNWLNRTERKLKG